MAKLRVWGAPRQRNSIATASLVLVFVMAFLGVGAAQSPASTEMDEATEARSKYGLDTSASKIRNLLTGDSDPASKDFRFPLSAAEASNLNRRSAFVTDLRADALPYIQGLDSYAGHWIDQRAGGKLVVMLTSVAETTKQRIRSRMPSPSLGVRFEEVDDSWRSLSGAFDRSERDWADLGTSVEPQAFAIDEPGNRLVVKVLAKDLDKARNQKQRMQQRAGVDVAFEATRRIVNLADYSECDGRWQCYGPFRLGVKMFYGTPGASWRCGMGFHMKHDNSSEKNQTILTAGHCGHNRSGNWHHSQLFKNAYGKIGQKKKSAYNTTKERDLMLVKLQDWGQNKTRQRLSLARPSPVQR